MPMLSSFGGGSARGFGFGLASGGGAIDYANANFDSQVTSAQAAVNTFSVSAGATYGVKIWGGGGGGGRSRQSTTFSYGGRGAYFEGFVVAQGNQFRLSGAHGGATNATDVGGVASASTIQGGTGGEGATANEGGGGGAGASASLIEWSNNGNSWTKSIVAAGGGGGGGNDQGQDFSISGSNNYSAKGGDGGYFNASNQLGLHTSAIRATGEAGGDGGQATGYPGAQGNGGGGGGNSGGAGGNFNYDGNAGDSGSGNAGGGGGNVGSANAGGGGGGGGGYLPGGGGGASAGGKYSQAGGGGAGASYLDGSVFVYLRSSSVSNSNNLGTRGTGRSGDGGVSNNSINGKPGRVELWNVSD